MMCSQRCLCGLVLAVMGTMFFFSAICCTSIYMKLTPLYTAIECRQQSAALQDLKLGMPLISPTEFALLIEMNCSNPNPYALSFEFTEPGEVYLGKSMTHVGETFEAANKTSHFPAEGQGPFWVKATTRISATMLAGVATDLLSSRGTLELRLELRQRLMVDVTLVLGAAMAVQQDFKKDCGLMVGNLGLKPTIGPLSCADSFKELSILPASAGSDDGVMRFAAHEIAPKVISRGALAKNAGLGSAMGVCYLLGLVCYVCAGRRFWQIMTESKAAQANVRQKVELSEASASSSESEPAQSNASWWPAWA